MHSTRSIIELPAAAADTAVVVLQINLCSRPRCVDLELSQSRSELAAPSSTLLHPQPGLIPLPGHSVVRLLVLHALPIVAPAFALARHWHTNITADHTHIAADPRQPRQKADSTPPLLRFHALLAPVQSAAPSASCTPAAPANTGSPTSQAVQRPPATLPASLVHRSRHSARPGYKLQVLPLRPLPLLLCSSLLSSHRKDRRPRPFWSLKAFAASLLLRLAPFGAGLGRPLDTQSTQFRALWSRSCTRNAHHNSIAFSAQATQPVGPLLLDDHLGRLFALNCASICARSTSPICSTSAPTPSTFLAPSRPEPCPRL